MTNISKSFGIFVAFFLASCVHHDSSSAGVSLLMDPSAGPGVPTILAPGTVNTAANREIEGMFGADMDTFYFIRRPWGEGSAANALIELKYQDDQWHESVIMEGVSEPSIAPDGKTIFFKNMYAERTPDGWSDLKRIGAPLDEIDIMRLSEATSGTVYFDTFTPDLDMPLRYSRFVNGKYQTPTVLGAQFGVGTYNAHPFIAPDESYVIWDSRRPDGYGSSDLYISFRGEDGAWGPAINMGGEINSSQPENYPSVSPDGKFLIFDRRGNKRAGGERSVEILWVDAQVIETLRREN